MMDSPENGISLPSLINAPPFVPPRRRKLKPGRPIAGPLGDGVYPGRRRGTGSDLDSIGAFQDGDDPRHIDWAATARTGRPQVRRFLNTVHRPLTILVDLRASMFFGIAGSLLAATACREAAGLSAYLLKRREPFAIRSLTNRVAGQPGQPRASASSRVRAIQLEHLAATYHLGLKASDSDSPTLDAALAACRDTIPFNHEIMLISDFSRTSDGLTTFISKRRVRSVHALIVSDPVFKKGFLPGLYPGRADAQSPVEAYQLPRQSTAQQASEIIRWRNELVMQLQRSGFGTIWERSA